MRLPVLIVPVALSTLGGCSPPAPPVQPAPRVSTATPAPAPSAAAAPAGFDRVERKDFNRRAVERDLPLFWRSDENGNRALDPNELAVLWGRTQVARSEFVSEGGAFTARFGEAYRSLLAPLDESSLSAAERTRRAAVRAELAQGRPTLLESDFSNAAPAEQALIGRLFEVARLIERLYARQKGTAELEARVPADDPASQALFFRNQGPFCVAPKTEQNPACHALPERAARVAGLYPSAIQNDTRFCERLEREPNAKELMDHFGVVVEGPKPKAFSRLPYSKAYPEETQAIAALLEAAAATLGGDEAAFKQYLLAAAGSFRSDDWEPANEAWVAMSPQNSKYYLRVGPDEVYFEPCAWKAGFALTLARINRDSGAYSALLEPFKQELEDEVAALAGKPYRARPVKFKLPDFIDIVLNAGDARSPLGGTIGQSLPNWGPVAKRGGRTVMMTNISTDVDSQEQSRTLMSSLFCKATMAKASTDPKVSVLSVVLHEAAHNLGPSHDYAAGGKVSEVAFGGGLAATLEELKAQTAALYFPRRLVERRLITEQDAVRGQIQNVAWAFGHIAQGMYDASGQPRHYSQLASIQLGNLTQAGALVFRPEELADNASARGCFDVDFARLPPAVDALFKQVLEIKAKGDRASAERLKQEWVDLDNAWKQARALITERWLRAPKASFVYSVRAR
ncbi:MAG TPA: hypothetical protein VGK73_17145 [Polyangiaceae bacterium]